MISMQVHVAAMLLGVGLCFLSGCEPALNSRPGRYSFGDRFANGGSFHGSDPVIMLDGKSIVFASPSISGRGDICMVDLDGSNWRDLAAGPDYEGQPEVSPDGRQIAYISEQGGMPHIYLMEIDGSYRRRLTKGNWPEHSPRFSKDGSTLFFARHLSDNPDDWITEEVFVVDTDGKNERQLTRNAVRDYPLHASDDGASVYCASGVARTQLVRVDLESGATTSLGIENPVDVSDDGRSILFLDDREERHKYELYLNGPSKTRKLTTSKSAIGSARFQAGNSKACVFVAEKAGGSGNGRGRITVIDLGTGEQRSICDNVRAGGR